MALKIRVENVTKIFGKDPGKMLLMLQSGASKDEIFKQTGHIVGVADVSLEINEGEIFMVMGLSGSGKSTLIRCINGIHSPTYGRILVDDEDMVSVDHRRMQEIRRTKMSMVFQHFALFPHMTVADNVAYGLKVRGVDREARRAQALHSLAQVGLEGWADAYPHNLSGGMQQRVGLARALAPDPDMLLMDEAFSALDPLIRRQMQNELLQLQARVQKTIVFITHDLNEALRVGTRVAVMKDGRIVQVGTPTEIVTKPEDEYVAEFMADVDQAKVLGVDFVMKEVEALVLGEATCGSALDRIQDARALYVVDRDRRPVGYVTRASLVSARQNGSEEFGKAIISDFPQTSDSVVCAGLFRLGGQGVPIAVVDQAGLFRGVVDPIDLLAKLGDVEVVDAPEAEETPAEADAEPTEVHG
jgi:glycine betaine/proline transport system ATP-binding protein